MLTDTLNNISELIGIHNSILPNIITFMIIVVMLSLSLKANMNWATMTVLYFIVASILALLGIDSIFNIIILIETAINLILTGVIYGY